MNIVQLQSIVVILKVIFALLQGNPSPETIVMAQQQIVSATQDLALPTIQSVQPNTQPNIMPTPQNVETSSILVQPQVLGASPIVPTSTLDSSFAHISIQQWPDNKLDVTLGGNGDPSKGLILRSSFIINGHTFIAPNVHFAPAPLPDRPTPQPIDYAGDIWFSPSDAGMATGTAYDYTWHAENDKWYTDGAGTYQLP